MERRHALNLSFALPLAPALALALAVPARSAPPGEGPAPAVAWSFAVSGDSRDCGDLVMPKIARAVADEAAPGIELYWHLGDFRRMFDVDCDVLARSYPGTDCVNRPTEQLPADVMSRYLDGAWDDFVERQLSPFGSLPILLGIGNHELYGRSREEFSRRFRPWLAQKRLHVQRLSDYKNGLQVDPGETSYHFVHRGVDLVYLDNADEAAFTPRQLLWLAGLLAQDAKDDSVRAIVVGMHESLPFSKAGGHGMDDSCQGICSGQRAYDLLVRAQRLAGDAAQRKRVYVLSSHAHTYLENVYDVPEHQGQVLPGWIVGTGGAQQFGDRVVYGYLRMDVTGDGMITATFREVTRTSPPLATYPGGEQLTDFCFEKNRHKPGPDPPVVDCACGAAR